MGILEAILGLVEAANDAETFSEQKARLDTAVKNKDKAFIKQYIEYKERDQRAISTVYAMLIGVLAIVLLCQVFIEGTPISDTEITILVGLIASGLLVCNFGYWGVNSLPLTKKGRQELLNKSSNSLE